MASYDATTQTRVRRPALATTYEGTGSELLDRLIPLVDYLEISPDSISRREGRRARLRPEILDQLASASSQVGLLIHGVGLSIGSFDGWNEPYLDLLDEFFSRLTPRWHSEHLGFTTVGGEPLGTMLALPRTEAILDFVCERIRRLQERYPVPFLVEHIIQLLPDAPAEYTPAGFLNQITARTGCGLILDAYNLECDQQNWGLDLVGFLDELNLAPVREIHLAGGFQFEGFKLDIHSQPTAESTLILAEELIGRCPNLEVITWELLKEAIPSLGSEAICAELRRLRRKVMPC